MKALTICQPYAELIVRGVKPIENRTWPTGYRGELLIHAGKSQAWLDPDDIATYPTMKFGAVIAVAHLVACLNLDQAAKWPAAYQHLATHEHANGPWCWVLENIRPLTEPLECRGAQGLWLPPTWLVSRVQGMKLERVAVDAQRRAQAHVSKHLKELEGKNLSCFCSLAKPCHADILLALANGRTLPPTTMAMERIN